MLIEFAYPEFLWLLVPLAAHAVWMARRLAGLARGRRYTALAVRLLILTALVCAVAGMKVSFASKDLTVFFVVDDSDSVPRAQRDYAKAFIQSAHKQMSLHDRQWILMFGADACIEQTNDSQPEFEAPAAVVKRSGSNIANALQLALACASGAAQKRIVLLSDGNQNAGSAEEAARAAVAAGISVDVVPLKYTNRRDVIVEKALVENRVSLDQPFDIRVIATATEATPGKLSVYQDGALLGIYDVELKPSQKNSFVIPTKVRDAGYHRFEVQIDAENDAIPENNRAATFTYGEGEPRVLYVEGDDPQSLTLPAALKSEKINVEMVRPSGMPMSLRALQMYDEIIFNNVGAGEIGADMMKMMEIAVHDLGIGFIMVGGQNSFGAGGYNDSPVERILPVEMEMKNEKVIPKGALVTIVHTVEIPEGQYWAEQVVFAALDVLGPRDEMGCLQYSWQTRESWLFPLEEVGTKTKMRDTLSKAQWGDMPSFDTTLQMAYDSLVASKASVKHVVVISDGDPQTPNWNLVKKIQAAKITISTVCINPHSPRDQQMMNDLAGLGGGNYYYPTSYNQLPQIFIKEATTVRKSLIIEEPFTPVAKTYSPVLTGFSAPYPQLLGYVGTSPKSLADIPLTTDKGDPLFAHWRHGLGKTVAYTSDAKERWAKDWISWSRFSKFWAQTVRWALRKSFNRNFDVKMEIDGAEGKVIVDAVDDKGEFRNFLNVKGRVITPSLQPADVEFRQTSPGRYEAPFKVTEAGAYMLGAQALAGAGADAGDLITGGVTLSYSPEFRNSSSNEPLLYRLCDLTKGRVLDAKSPVFIHDRASRAEPALLWPWLLAALMPLFLFDVFLRRVIIGWKEVGAGLGFVWDRTGGWLLSRSAPAEGVSDNLFEAKKRAFAKEDEPETPANREELFESLRKVKVETSLRNVTALEKKMPAPSLARDKPTAAKPSAREEDGSHTGRLLQARAQARKKLHLDKNTDSKGDSKP
ncbi:MAG: VWA domain-containing protein [Candidatus Sumerlaeota bacterium]|nr:VWA domain-containing protein [Candidatus Sumerlaeota bacterium]